MNLENLLKERNLTKSAFAEMVGVKKQNINNLLKNPTLETLHKFATALNVPLWQLFASPEEVMSEASHSHAGITCPKCGAKLTLKVEE